MIGYKDKTWCASPNCRNECGRQFTEEDRRLAINWWGGPDYPISKAWFCDEDGNVKERRTE